MIRRFNQFIDKASEFLASRKGLLPIIGLILIVLNFILQFLLPGWISEFNLLLHAGLVISIFGLMLAWAL